MRVLDPSEPRFPPPARRRGKKKPERVVDAFFKCRMLVPSHPDDFDWLLDWGLFDEDWAPNLPGPSGRLEEVEVTVLGWREYYSDDAEQPAFRVSVRGGDDLGYERDFHFTETEPAWLVQMVLDFPEPLTKDYLINQVGMWPA